MTVTATVYHLRYAAGRDVRFRASEGEPIPFESAYFEPVALLLEVDGPGDAFERTNTIDRPWHEADDVRLLGSAAVRGGARSTSVGDVIRIGDECLRVARAGFVPVTEGSLR